MGKQTAKQQVRDLLYFWFVPIEQVTLVMENTHLCIGQWDLLVWRIEISPLAHE